jgi:hypothetical protein
MRKIIYILLFAVLAGNFIKSFSLTLDTNVFKYYPLKVGNRWSWQGFAYPIMPPLNMSQKIISTRLINNHLYYFSRLDQYQYNGTILNTIYNYSRIDSLTGNLFTYDTINHTDCLIDSLNVRKNDSAYSCVGKWYKCDDTANFNIFNLNLKSRSFYWTNYFEGGDRHRLALGIGKVRIDQYGAQFQMGHTLKGCLINGVLYGDTSLVGINQISSEIPGKFSLSQNYPNPFNPNTKIQFALPNSAFVKVIVYDALGKEVETIVNEQLNAGTFEAEWNAVNYPSGVYYYKLSAGDYSETKKMVLIR